MVGGRLGEQGLRIPVEPGKCPLRITVALETGHFHSGLGLVVRGPRPGPIPPAGCRRAAVCPPPVDYSRMPSCVGLSGRVAWRFLRYASSWQRLAERSLPGAGAASAGPARSSVTKSGGRGLAGSLHTAVRRRSGTAGPWLASSPRTGGRGSAGALPRPLGRAEPGWPPGI